MRYFLIFAGILLHLISFSQDYKTVFSNRVATFANNGGYGIGSFCFNGYYAIEIDSSTIINEDTIYYNFNVIRNDTGLYCDYKRSPNWTGSKTIIKTNGDNIFLSSTQDSIRIKTKAALNDKWHLYDFSDGNYFEGEVTTKSLGSVLGNSDSLKIIAISLKDNLGNPLPHEFNGKEIILSKNHGVVKAYDFFAFPTDTTAFILSGLSNPALGIQNITAREIFDYNIGDEFHIEDRHTSSLSNPLVYHGIFDTERKTILSKNISLNDDTLEYEYERVLYRKNYNSNGTVDTTITIDTLTEKIIVSEYVTLNLVSIKQLPPFFPDLNNNYCFYNSQFNNRLQKVPGEYQFMATNDTCFTMIVTTGTPVTSYYIDGLGTYYNGDYLPFMHEHRTLLYYKKGTETWGTPVNFSTLLSNYKKTNSEINIEIFPNPFSDYTKIKINNHTGSIYRLTISDMYGKVVKEISFSESEIIINKDDLKNGMYLYKIQDDKNHISSGKMIVAD